MSEDVKVDKMVAERHEELDRELRKCLKQINSQIEEIRLQAVATDIPPVKMRDSKGDYIWAPLVIAKASVLSALAQLDPGAPSGG